MSGHINIVLPLDKLSLGSVEPEESSKIQINSLARDALCSEGFCVIGGYMSPVNDAYKKRPCRSSEFVMVDPWEMNLYRTRSVQHEQGIAFRKGCHHQLSDSFNRPLELPTRIKARQSSLAGRGAASSATVPIVTVHSLFHHSCICIQKSLGLGLGRGKTLRPIISRPSLREIHGALHKGLSTHRGMLALNPSITVQEQSQWLYVVLKTKPTHCTEDVLSGDGLALLVVAALVGFASDEADEFGDALLDVLFGVVGDLDMLRENPSHYPSNVGNGHELVTLTDINWK
ncbi:unnamed protein product [Camellia sinensis]